MSLGLLIHQNYTEFFKISVKAKYISETSILRSNYTDISVSFSPGEFPLKTNGKLHVSIFILHESVKTDIKAHTIVCQSIIVQSCGFVGPRFQRCISLKKVGQLNPSYTMHP